MLQALLEKWAAEGWWLFFGLAAQACFAMRFIYQWFVSERRGRSTIPLGFWFLSLGGGVMLFIYAVHIQNLVFMLGQGLGVFIYVRNLMLIFRRRSVQRRRHPQLVGAANREQSPQAPAEPEQSLSP